jgi:hypothetical protein
VGWNSKGIQPPKGACFEVKKYQRPSYKINVMLDIPSKKHHKCIFVFLWPFTPFQEGRRGTIVEKERTNFKQWHLKGFKPNDIRESGKQYASHILELLRYMNISVVKGIPNGMHQRVLI